MIHNRINLSFISIFFNCVCYITNKFGFLFIGGVAMTTVFQRQCWLTTSCHFLLMFDSLYPRQPTWFWLSAKCRQSCLYYSVYCSPGLHKSLRPVIHLCWSLSVSIGLYCVALFRLLDLGLQSFLSSHCEQRWSSFHQIHQLCQKIMTPTSSETFLRFIIYCLFNYLLNQIS